MAEAIDSNIAKIQYQHREELFNNLLWLAQSGEQAIPSLLRGLQHPEPKVRSNCAWVLGRIGDRRTVANLRPLTRDKHETVRLEAARSLLAMGDMQPAPILIEGLDSDKVQVRYLAHEALKAATRHDFGYDHLSEDLAGRQATVYEWRKWWTEQSGDPFFADSYKEKHGIGRPQVSDPVVPPPAPGGETEKRDAEPDSAQPLPIETDPQGEPGTQPVETQPVETEPVEAWPTQPATEPLPGNPATPTGKTEPTMLPPIPADPAPTPTTGPDTPKTGKPTSSPTGKKNG